MLSADAPDPDLRTLVGSWWALTRYVARVFLARAERQRDRAADAVRDLVLDFDWPGADDPPARPGVPVPLPPLCPDQFTRALGPHVERVLQRAAAAINDDPGGCWQALTEERVAALFHDLGRLALEQGLDLRVAAAETEPPAGLQWRWARRYRRHRAAEGRWPPAPQQTVGREPDSA
jgi:hypothetical protein